MKTNMTVSRLLLLLFCVTLINTALLAQEETKSQEKGSQEQEETKEKTRAFQLSFITPLGTNGLNSWNVTNRVSFNILTGYAAGVNGVEFSGLGSLLKTNMRGAQFSGLGNIVLGETKGGQFSGLFNINVGKTKAWQFAGLTNIVTKETSGVQCSGLTNIVADTFTGAQISGFGNVITKNAKGIQIAGFGNYAKGNKISQISGFMNISVGDTKGVQVTGFVNTDVGKMKGTQIAGFTNINTKRIKGLQLAGFFNYAKRLKGVQIAPFNYVDSLEKGVPIGFLSFVRNGYMTFEVSVTETMYGVVSFKTGVRQFYNILSVGVGYRQDKILLGYGYGLGGMITLAPKWDLAIEGLCYQMNEGEWFTNRLNLLNKLNVTASWKIKKHLNVFAGISWNVTVSDITDEYGAKVTPIIAPWSVYDKTNGTTNVKMYPGFTFGIRL